MPSLSCNKLHKPNNIAGIPFALFSSLSEEIHQLYSAKQTWNPFMSDGNMKLTFPFENRYSGDIDLLLECISNANLPPFNTSHFESSLVILVSKLHCYRAKLFRFESREDDQTTTKKLMRATAIRIVDGICKLIAELNTKIEDPAIVLGSLVFAAATECLDPQSSDTVVFRIIILNLICRLKNCHQLKLNGSKADSDREKLFQVWGLGIGYCNKLF